MLLHLAASLSPDESECVAVVGVTDHARLVTHLVARLAPGAGAVFHASHPVPVRSRDRMATLAGHGILPRADRDLSWAECVRHLGEAPGRVSERPRRHTRVSSPGSRAWGVARHIPSWGVRRTAPAPRGMASCTSGTELRVIEPHPPRLMGLRV
ncbi:hypothetical protein ACIRYZ_37405 [Kitasatospora sp. NPDC101155]|uniref:hypothetical protein n=1 Tax=Kitasatospora sp. NPDC101155 TaxID=3364097 RepID=UPI0037F4FF03